MGRMADLLRNGDHRADRTDEPVILSVEPHVAAVADDEVPFIEVGGPRESAKAPARTPTLVVAASPSASPGLFAIRFEPVVPAQLYARGFAPELIVFHQPDHGISAQYRALVGEIVSQLPGSDTRVLMFAGATDGAGTTTVLLNLAVTLARQDATRVAVLDGHLSRPALAPRLGITSGPGLREVLARQTPLAWSLQETALPNLLALPGGRPTTPRVDAPFAPLVEQLRPRCDWVLIDAGVWGGEAAAMADACDAVYLVQRQADAGTSESVALQSAVLEATGRLRGCVLTQA